MSVNAASIRVEQSMQYVQARMAAIEERTGIPFSAHMMRSQMMQMTASRLPVAPVAADGVYDGGNNFEISVTTLPGTLPQGAEDQFILEPESPNTVGAGFNHSSSVGAGEAFARLPASDYDTLFLDVSERYGVSAALIKALCFAESSFRPDTLSRSGAMGLMQLMPATAEALGVTDAFDPYQNVDGGARYIASMLDRFGGDALRALAAYNCGASRITSRGITDLTDPAQRALLPDETRRHLENIERYLNASQAGSVLEHPYAA